MLAFPLTSTDESRQRPGLVLLDTGDADIVVARITSQPPRTPFDVEVNGWQQAGLLLPSIIRLDKVATLEKRLVERRLGTLSREDGERVRGVLKRIWEFN